MIAGSLISLLVALIVLGLLWYLVTFLPLPAPFPLLIRVVFVVIAIIWIIYALVPGAHTAL